MLARLRAAATRASRRTRSPGNKERFNDPAFQPDFERADTTVSGVICLYGYYGPIEAKGQLPSSPLAYVGKDAPPFFVAHGDLDRLVLAKDARGFVERLVSVSQNPVVYAELPGAQHAFDLFHSLRFEKVVDAIEAFTAWGQVASRHGRWPRGQRSTRPLSVSEVTADPNPWPDCGRECALPMNPLLLSGPLWR
jgi:acetyl esterase/lipase